MTLSSTATTAALLASTLAVGLTAGCGNTSSSAGAPIAPPASPSATGGDVGRQTGEATSPSPQVFTDARVVERDGGDRIVLEFTGRGTPGWVAEYVDEPVLEGSGEVVDLDGDAVLSFLASGTTWPSPDYYDGPSRLASADGGAVAEVYVAGTFEGYTQVLVGVDGERAPYTVSTRADPSRLVLDIVRIAD